MNREDRQKRQGWFTKWVLSDRVRLLQEVDEFTRCNYPAGTWEQTMLLCTMPQHGNRAHVEVFLAIARFYFVSAPAARALYMRLPEQERKKLDDEIRLRIARALLELPPNFSPRK